MEAYSTSTPHAPFSPHYGHQLFPQKPCSVILIMLIVSMLNILLSAQFWKQGQGNRFAYGSGLWLIAKDNMILPLAAFCACPALMYEASAAASKPTHQSRAVFQFSDIYTRRMAEPSSSYAKSAVFVSESTYRSRETSCRKQTSSGAVEAKTW